MINDDMTEYLRGCIPLLEDELTLMRDMIRAFEDGPVIESERRVCDGLSQETRDRFLVLGLRCHMLMEHIEHIDDPNWDEMSEDWLK